MTELRQRNRKLKENLLDKRVVRKELQGELLQAESQRSQAVADRQQLQAEVHAMRHSLEVSVTRPFWVVLILSLSGWC